MISWKAMTIGLALMLAVLQLNLWIGQGSIAELVALGREIDRYTGTNAELRDRNRRLQVEVEELKSGHDSVEEAAREELGMIRQDESFYVVIER